MGWGANLLIPQFKLFKKKIIHISRAPRIDMGEALLAVRETPRFLQLPGFASSKPFSFP